MSRKKIRQSPEMSTEDFRLLVAKTMTESALQSQVIAEARFRGFTHIYHTTFAIGSKPGFPDLVMVRPSDKRVVYAELKSEKGAVSEGQLTWINALAEAGQEVYVWRPSDLPAIREVLA